MGIKGTHLLSGIGDPQQIEQAQHKAVEDGQDPWSNAFAHLTMIFLHGDIAPPMQPIFNGPVGSA
jgi:hypothetical protein